MLSQSRELTGSKLLKRSAVQPALCSHPCNLRPKQPELRGYRTALGCVTTGFQYAGHGHETQSLGSRLHSPDSVRRQNSATGA